jgi:hypothetical protein
MKRIFIFLMAALASSYCLGQNTFPASGKVGIGKTTNLRTELDVNGYVTSNINYFAAVTFSAGYQIGDYIEFLRVLPNDAGASGYYEVSISYTRGNVAAAATFLASIEHSGAALWRQVGRINSNGYTTGSSGHNFTIDCNSEYSNSRFRIRAINTLGVTGSPLPVNITVRSINQNIGWIPLSATGNDLTVTKFHPMTNDWTLYVGNTTTTNGAITAIKALENGNIGIGTETPTDKLSVKGKIRAQEIKVEMANWADFVFGKDYVLLTLQETEKHIKEKGHLPGIPSAAEVEKNGIELGDMNKKLLQKIEELTLYMIEMKKENENMKNRMVILEKKSL